MILIYVKTLIMLMIPYNNYQQWLKKGGKELFKNELCYFFRTGLRAPHMVLGGALVPAGTVLVTPGIEYRIEYNIEYSVFPLLYPGAVRWILWCVLLHF